MSLRFTLATVHVFPGERSIQHPAEGMAHAGDLVAKCLAALVRGQEVDGIDAGGQMESIAHVPPITAPLGRVHRHDPRR